MICQCPQHVLGSDQMVPCRSFAELSDVWPGSGDRAETTVSNAAGVETMGEAMGGSVGGALAVEGGTEACSSD